MKNKESKMVKVGKAAWEGAEDVLKEQAEKSGKKQNEEIEGKRKRAMSILDEMIGGTRGS